MRYIGQKTKLLDNIELLLSDKKILSKDLVFCDAFSGTATVGMYFKDKYKKIISNDNLYFSYILTQAKLNIGKDKDLFRQLGYDPFEYFNSYDTNDFVTGFIYNNYAPTIGKRKYFSDENAKKIDYIRCTIDEWFEDGKITEKEKYYLIACLIESVSFVSNVAGVYGSYLSKWDQRALKPMRLRRIEHCNNSDSIAEIYNEDIIPFIKKVKGDILYIDPPYTKNVYTTQYHLLETLAKYDSPEIKGKGGLRSMTAYSTSLSKPNEAEVVFEKIIKNAQFEHIILSYSCDGIISKEYIESVFKRYGIEESFEMRKTLHKRYKNSVAENNENHNEYLFYIKKKASDKVIYSSPLNYVGGKADMIDWLRMYMPSDILTFYDLFGGGLNVSLNINANSIVYNDINFKVKELLEYIIQQDTGFFLSTINQKIKKYGLENGNKEAYLKLREDYNKTKISNRNVIDLFLLIIYGFQQQIRFNSEYNYNNPVGHTGFNERLKEKLVTFSSEAKQKDITLSSEDFEKYKEYITSNDFVYLDPPYLITLGSYNDGKRGFNGWSESDEVRLLNFIKELDKKNIKFMLSNVLEHNGRKNILLRNFIDDNGFTVIEYPGKARGNRKEIIVINYPTI
ncbi:MAG: Dam family site-specific DNA-(adenine-N6)-methyltransferase [Lachnospiraceae bacterium]|nr:Dam family site-specific DNA-(adenine-N6)-methyltransferase [Lachnospiraceae bacterium]